MLHLDMGRYAMFVWPAWGLSVLVLGALVADTLLRARRAKAALNRAEAGQ
jgi:heme exporter protein D